MDIAKNISFRPQACQTQALNELLALAKLDARDEELLLQEESRQKEAADDKRSRTATQTRPQKAQVRVPRAHNRLALQARTDDDPWICGDTYRESSAKLESTRADDQSDVLPTLFVEEKATHDTDNNLHLLQAEATFGVPLYGAWGLLVSALSLANPAMSCSLVRTFSLVQACKKESKRAITWLASCKQTQIDSLQPLVRPLKKKCIRSGLKKKLVGLGLSSVLDSCLMAGRVASYSLRRQAQAVWSRRVLENTVRTQLASACPVAALLNR